MADNNFYLKLQGELDKVKSQVGITEDIKDIEKQIDSLKIKAELDEKSIQNIIKQLNNVLNQKVTVGNGIGEGIQKSVEESLRQTKKLIADTFKSLPKLNASDLISKFNLNSKDVDSSVVAKVRELTKELNILASEVVKTNSDTVWGNLIKNIVELGDSLNQFGKIKADTSQYESILKLANELKKTKIYVDPSIKNDVLAGANVSSLKELNNELISMGVSFTTASNGAKNLDSVWEEFVNTTNRSDLSNITNSADKVTAVVNELRNAKEVLYGSKTYQSAEGYGTEEMLSWVNSIEQASKKMTVYQNEQAELEKQLASVVVQSEKQKQDAIEQTQKARQKQSSSNADKSALTEKQLLNFDARRAKILQEISTYLSQNGKLTANNTAEARVLQGKFEQIRQEVQALGRGDNSGLSILSKQLSTAKLKAKELKLEGMSLSEEFGKLFKRFNSWFSVGQFSFAVTNKIREAITEIKDLDSILTEISKTSDLTTSQLNALGDSAFDTASKYGKSASDYLTGVQEMYRAGFDNAEQMAELSVLAQTAGDMNAEMANNYLIATNSAYKLKGNVEALNEILDSQNYITNNAAVSMNDMSSATSKAASIAAQSGVKINELSALIATGVAQTKKSGDEVGTAIKSIFVNLQNTQSDKIVKTFDSVGISMTEMVNGAEKLKDPIELIKELAKVYNSLDEGSPLRANIVNNLAGKYQANVFAGILSGIDDYEKMLKLYSEGSGSAMEEAKKSASNLESALNRINNTITDIVDNVLNSKLLTDSANGLNDILGLVNQLTDKLGTLGTISVIGAGIIGANKKSSLNLSNIIAQYKDLNTTVTKYNTITANANFSAEKFNASLKNNNTMMGEYLKSLNGASASIGGYIKYLATAKVQTLALSAATTTLNMALSMGASLIVTGLISAFSSWVNKSEEITKSAQEAKDKISAIKDELNANTETVENAKRRYAELAQEVENLGKVTQSKGTLSNEEYEEFLDLSNQLAGVFPSLTKKYDENGNAILDLSGDVDSIVGTLDNLIQKEKELTNQKIMEEFPDLFAGYSKDMSKAKQDVKDAQTEFDKINNAYQQLSNGSAKQAFDLNGNGEFENDNGEKIKITLSEYEQSLKDLGIAYEKTNVMVANSFGGKSLSGYLIEATGDIDTAFTSQLETARDNLKYAKQQLEAESSSINSYLNTWLQTEFSYNQIEDTGLQEAIQEMLFNLDWDNLPENIDKNDWSAVSEYLKRNILFAINNIQDTEISNALSKIFSNIELTPNEKVNYIKQVQDYFGKDNIITLSLQPQLVESEALQKQYSDAITKFGEDNQGALNKFFKDNSINDSSEIDYWNDVTEGAKNAEDAVRMYNEEKNKASKTEVSTFSFTDLLNSDDNKDIAKELNKLAEAGELTPNTLSSTKEYNKLLKETGITAQEATEQLYNMVDANTRLSAFSNNMDNVDKAYAQFKTDGFNTMDTLSGLQSAFGDLDYYKKFIQIAGDAKSSTQEIQSAYNKLVTEYVYSIGILDNVNESNRGLIQTQLEHLGITNAEEIVTKALNGEILSLADAKSILTQHGYDLINVTSGELNALVKEGSASKETAQQIALFALKKKIANGVSITTDGDIANLAALAGVGSKVIEMMNSLATMKQKMVSGDGEAGTAGGSEYLQSKAKKLENDIRKELNKGTKINFNVDYSGGDTTSSALEKQTNKNKKTLTKFSQTIDWCAETIANLSNKISNLNAKLNNTDALQKQIKYYKQLITAQNGLIKGYEKTGSRYQKVYNNSLKKLSKEDQKKVKNGTYTIEQFSGKAKSGKKSSEEKRYNNIQKAIKARDNVISNSTDLENAKAQFKEYAKALASVRWDKASEQVDKLNTKVGVLDTRMSNVSGYKAKNAVLDDQLKLQKQILTAQENAVNKTQSDANSYYKKISSKYKKNKNKDGTIKTAGVTNKAQLNLIKIYNAYVKQLAEETVALSQAQEDYTSAVNDAAITGVDNVKNDYDNRISLLEATQDQIDAEASLAEARGQVASANYYKMLTDNSKEIKKQREEEKAQLESQLATLTPYTDTWYAVKQAIFDVDKAIADQTKNAVENVNKQIEAMKQLTNQVNAYISSATDALSWYDDLIDSEDLYDDNGNLTNKAYASLKLKDGGIEGSKTRQGNYQKDLTELERKYTNGEITEAQYLTRKLELEESIRNEYKTQIDLRREQNDIIKEGYKAQKEALDKILEKKKKALDLDKSEYDYRKSITEKTKNIADLQKQLAMLEGDNSESAMAQKQQVKVQLEDAQEDLKDTQYEKYIERYEDAMDNLSDRLDALIEKLDELTPEEIKQVVIANEPNANVGINEISQENGVPITVLGDTGKTVATGSTDNMDETYNKANEKATNAYNSEPTPIATEKLPEENKTTFQQAETNGEIPESIKKLLGNSDTSNSNYVEATGVPLLSKDLANKVKKFINNKDNTEKAKKKKSEYGILNKEIYDITNGRILNKANRLKLAKMLNVTDTNKDGDITGAEAKKVVELLKSAGFANGGIVQAVKRNGDDGIATLKVGESVLTPVQTTALMEFGKNLVPLNNMMDIFQRPNIPTVERSVSSATTNNIENTFEFNLPNVTDGDSFMKVIQTDSRVLRTIQSAGTDVRNSNRKFGINRL